MTESSPPPIQLVERPRSDKEFLDKLEWLLERARRGETVGYAIAEVQVGGNVVTSFSFRGRHGAALIGVLECLKSDIMETIDR